MSCVLFDQSEHRKNRLSMYSTNRVILSLIASVLFLGLAACQTSPVKSDSSRDESKLIVSEKSKVILGAKSKDDVGYVLVKQSPWGNELSARIQVRYFAASGRECIKLRLTQKAQDKLICQDNHGFWLESRLLTAVKGEK